MSRPSEHPLVRAAALVAALCVLMLAVFAASPALHAGLHAAPAAGPADGAQPGGDLPVGDPGHACAVNLFAHGAAALLVFCLLILVRPAAAGLALRASDTVAIAQPRYRLVPSHAPPAA